MLVDGDTIEVAWTAPAMAAREIVPGSTRPHRPMKAEARSVLLRQVALGRRWLAGIVEGSATIESIAVRERWSIRQVERTIALAFLSPDIIQAAAHANLPRGTSAAMFADAPASWAKQRQMLGI